MPTCKGDACKPGTAPEAEVQYAITGWYLQAILHMLQVYGQNRDLKLHDVIEVTGVFSCNPELAAPHFDIMSLFERADLTANHPPTSLVNTQCLQCSLCLVLHPSCLSNVATKHSKAQCGLLSLVGTYSCAQS